MKPSNLARVALPLCLLCVTLAPAPTQAATPDASERAQTLSKEALDAYRKRAYEDAALGYADALKLVEHAAMRFMLGRSLEQLGRFDAAAEAYDAVSASADAGERGPVAKGRAEALRWAAAAQEAASRGDKQQAVRTARHAHETLRAQAEGGKGQQGYAEPAAALFLLGTAERMTGHRKEASDAFVLAAGDKGAPDRVRTAALTAMKDLAMDGSRAAPEAVAPHGFVIVTSTEGAAELLVDGKAQRGKAPWRLALDAGKRELRVRVAGRADGVRTIEVAARKAAEVALATAPMAVERPRAPEEPVFTGPAKPRVSVTPKPLPVAVQPALPPKPVKPETTAEGGILTRWWFWTAVGAAVIGGTVLAVAAGSGSSDSGAIASKTTIHAGAMP